MSSDFIVIGAGIAGASAGYFLAPHGRVVILEGEDQPAYHATGRSAALFTEVYGNATIRALAAASRTFLDRPPDGFRDGPLLTPRGSLFIGRDDQLEALDRLFHDAGDRVPSVRRIGGDEAREMVPSLRPEYVAGAVHEPDAMEIDVHGLVQGYLRGVRAHGGEIVTKAEVRALKRAEDTWRADTTAGEFAAPIVVNAAGAWADRIGIMAGARAIGLMPLRRTVALFEPPADTDVGDWPLCADIDEQFYFKPEAGMLMGSLADETPSEPCDAQPEELDIAIAIDRIQRAAAFDVRRIVAKRAGLRSFVADRTPVAGYDPSAGGFFWLAGQGGYGIKTSPALGRLAASLVRGEKVPEEMEARGIREALLSPRRFGETTT